MPNLSSQPWRQYLHTALLLSQTVFGAFLCFVWVVIRPLSRLGGPFAFLCYTAYLLFFFPMGHLADQVEIALLNIVSLAVGLAWSVAWIALAARYSQSYGADSDQGRAALAVGLVLLAFICGFFRSYSPRFNIAARIPLFISIFLVTSVQDVTQVSSHYFTDTFLVALFACAFSIVSTLLLSRRSSGRRLQSLATASITTIGELLPASLHTILDRPLPSHSTSASTANLVESAPDPRVKQSTLVHSLRSTVDDLHPTFHEYTISIVRSRVPPKSLHGIVESLCKISKNPLLGEIGHVPGERIRHALERSQADEEARDPGYRGSRTGSRIPSRSHTPIHTPTTERPPGTADLDGDGVRMREWPGSLAVPPSVRFDGGANLGQPKGQNGGCAPPKRSLVDEADRLVSAVCSALDCARGDLHRLLRKDSQCAPSKATDSTAARTRLEAVVLDFQSDLYDLLNHASFDTLECRTPDDPDSVAQRDHFRLAMYMTALLDLSKDISGLLAETIHLCGISDPYRTLRIPRLPIWERKKWGWTDDSSPTFRPRAGSGTGMDDAMDAVEDDRELASFEDLDFVHAKLAVARRPRMQAKTMMHRILMSWRGVWDNGSTVQFRVALSRAIHHARHSRHVLYAIKLAGGVSLLSLPAFLPPGTPGRLWFQDYRGAWMVISYMYVLEVHTGAILKIGLFRLIGTFFGAVIAYICTLIARDNPYALVTLATACSVPIHYLIVFTAYPVIGLVAGITLPPLVFLRYLGLADGESEFTLTWHRFIDIVIGIVAAVLVGMLVWPNHARVKYFNAVSGTIDRLMEYYIRMSRDNLRHSLVYQNNQRHYARLDRSVKCNMAVCRNLVDIQKNELSLLPRPTKLYGEVLDSMDRMISTMEEIRSLRSSLPRKETVLDVLPIRQEVASAVLINLWACAQAFRSRSPLPQYLPSPRRPIGELMEMVDDHARRFRNTTYPKEDDKSGGHGLAVLYAMAENEALGEVCNHVEEIVAAARTLFGTQSFMDSGVKKFRAFDMSVPPP